MFQFKRDFNAYDTQAGSLEFFRPLNPALETFNRWLVANLSRSST